MPDTSMGPSAQTFGSPNTSWLRPIHTPANANLDIVAVHGVNTASEGNQGDNAWAEPASKTHWLRDLLPRELPAARILSYDYNANVVFDPSPARIEQQALNLLHCLKADRKGNTTLRPIIFIAHCLGGVIVKSALASAYHGDGTYALTWVFTYGVVFFGVPHWETTHATWGEIATNILRVYTGTQNVSFLNSIERSSAYNDRLNEDFNPLLDAYIFCSVCETIAEPSHVGVVVEQDSAILGLPDGQECKILLNRSHTGICKFYGPGDQEFSKVVGPLRFAAKAATSSFDYSPTRDVRVSMLGNIVPSSEETRESLSSLADTERYVNLVLANINDLEQDLETIRAQIEEQNAVINGLLRWLLPFAALLLRGPFFGAITPTLGALGGVRTFMQKHEQGLQSLKRVVELQKEAVTLLDDRRSSALRAIRMLESARDRGLVSAEPMGEMPLPYREALLDDFESILIRRVEGMVCELQSQNRNLIEAQRVLREAKEFKESAEGKPDKEILVLAKERMRRAQAKQDTAPRHDKRRRECVIL